MPNLNVGISSRGAIVGAAGVNKALDSIDNKSKRTIYRIRRGFASLKNSLFGVKAALIGLGGSIVIGSILKVGTSFEQVMATTGGIMRATQEEMGMLTDMARKMGEQTEFSATQAGGALKFLGMTGFSATEAVSALPGVLDLATAGNVELARAADIASNALTAMQMPVEHLGVVNDVFVSTITRSNTNMEQLAEAFKYAAPAARAYGYSIEELSAMIGVLGDAGIQGSMAGTQLAFAFTKVDDVFSSLGMDGSGKGLVDALEAASAAGWDTNKFLDMLGIRGGKAGLVLKDLLPKFRELEQANKDSAGEAENLANIMRNTVGGAFKEFKSVIESQMINVFNRIKDEVKFTIKYLTAIVRNLGPIFNAVKEGLSTAFGGMGQTYIDMANNFIGGNEGIADSLQIIKKEFGLFFTVLAWGFAGIHNSVILFAGAFEIGLNALLVGATAIVDLFLKTLIPLLEKFTSSGIVRKLVPDDWLAAIDELTGKMKDFQKDNAGALDLMLDDKFKDHKTAFKPILEAIDKLVLGTEVIEDWGDGFKKVKAAVTDVGVAVKASFVDLALVDFFSEIDAQADRIKTRYQTQGINDRAAPTDPGALRTALGGMKDAWTDYKKHVEDVTGNIAKATMRAFKGMEDAIVNFAMTGAFEFREFAKSVIADIIRIITQQLMLKAVMGTMGFMGFSKGGAFGGKVTPFSQGDVLNKPTVFEFAKGIGVAGEKGPEAIMPLQRDSSGNLGVRAVGGAGGNQISIPIQVNIESPPEDAGHARQMGDVLGKSLEMKMNKILLNHLRPGGMLNRQA